jgi:hypothetical protein
MATLCLGEVDCSAPLLREWLAGDWALLFSHPGDFQDQGLERDRWLEILRDEFRARGVRPVACQRTAGDADGSWAAELIGDHRLLRLESNGTDQGVIDLPARSLREDILGLTGRFALIIDESLNRRGLLRYSAGRTTVRTRRCCAVGAPACQQPSALKLSAYHHATAAVRFGR